MPKYFRGTRCVSQSKDSYVLQALKAASEQPAAVAVVLPAHPAPPLSGESQTTPSRQEPSAEQQDILALTGDSKAAARAESAAVAADSVAATAAAISQHQQHSQNAAVEDHSQWQHVLAPGQQQQPEAQEHTFTGKLVTVSRQLSEVFADKALDAESVPEEVDSGISDSIEVSPAQCM